MTHEPWGAVDPPRYSSSFSMLLVHPSVHVQRKLKFLKRRGVAAVIWALVAWFFLSLAIPALPGIVPASWHIVVLWVLVALFAIATVMNGISRSRIERAIWTPVSAVLLVCALVNVLQAIALSGVAG